MIRDALTIEQRSLPLEHTIDPGFVHKRKIQTILGQQGMKIIDDMISKLPDLPDWQREVRINHMFKDVFLAFCELNGFKSLEALLSEENDRLFCATVELAPCDNIYDIERAVSIVIPSSNYRWEIELHYSTGLVSSDTLSANGVGPS